MAVDSLEPLWLLLSRLLHDLCAELQQQALATSQVELALRLESGRIHASVLHLTVATAMADPLFRLFKLRLEGNPPPRPVSELILTAQPATRRSTQSRLWEAPQLAPKGLVLTLARLKAIVGSGNVGTPVLRDTHAPDAFRVECFAGEGQTNRRVRWSVPLVPGARRATGGTPPRGTGASGTWRSRTGHCAGWCNPRPVTGSWGATMIDTVSPSS